MKTIAVIEDNPDNRLLFEVLLAERYRLRLFSSAPPALAALPSDPPDLALLDISLPGMDGLELLARLRDDPRTATLPVIALTAHAMAGDRERFLAAGFDAYFSKPIVDEEALFALIERLLATREQR